MIQLLRHQRHELMNDIQIIHGYVSMGKMEKVEEKLNAVIDNFHQERRLMNLNVPNFTLWLMQFNAMHSNIRLGYCIHIENINLANVDTLLLNQCKQIVDCIETVGDSGELYRGEIVLNELQSGIVGLTVAMEGKFVDLDNVITELRKKNNEYAVRTEKTQTGFACHYSIPFV